MKQQKNKQFGLRMLGWLMVAGLVILSLVKVPAHNVQLPNSDKWLHLISYFVLTYWFFHSYSNHNRQIVIGFSLLGIVLECLQAMTPHRYFEWLDMLMNITGVVLAYINYHWLKIRFKTLQT